MSLEEFLKEPWKTPHRAYDRSAFNIRPAPEFATAEVLMASVYRAIGYPTISEKIVPAIGRDFDKLTQRVRLPKTVNPSVSRETWRTILHGVLESPKQQNQSSKRFLQLSPVVPATALYSNTARLSGSSWNPGALIQRMIEFGCQNDREAEHLWIQIFHALSVSNDDDIWAQWLQAEFDRWNITEHKWQQSDFKAEVKLPTAERSRLNAPARQFVVDLKAVLAAKNSMTRRQWITVVETIMRLGAVTHVLWLCDVNDRLWRKIREVLEGVHDGKDDDLFATVINHCGTYLSYGSPGVPMIRELSTRYLVARLGLNLVLWHLEKQGVAITQINSMADIDGLIRTVRSRRDDFTRADFMSEFRALQDAHSRTVACKKGIGSNMVEFGRHVLGRRIPANDTQRGYDQGYFLKKKGEYNSAPWNVSFGPVAVLALAHCCLQEVDGPRSVQRFRQHLQCYGVDVHLDAILHSDLGNQMRMLGLVLDSPDAESGMLLVPPFKAITSQVAK